MQKLKELTLSPMATAHFRRGPEVDGIVEIEAVATVVKVDCADIWSNTREATANTRVEITNRPTFPSCILKVLMAKRISNRASPTGPPPKNDLLDITVPDASLSPCRE